MSQSDKQFHDYNNLPTAMFADCLANSKEIFRLIDSVFPVESCRHYEVLPLELKGQDLSLGMLDPNNEESFKFVNSIAKVFKYNLHLKLIDQQTLEILLTSYSKSSESGSNQNRNRNRDQQKTIIDATVIDQAFNPDQVDESNYSSRRRLADSAPTIISVDNEQNNSASSQPNLQGLNELPADMDFLRDLDLSSEKVKSETKPLEEQATLYEIPPEFLAQKSLNQQDDKPTLIAEDPSELLAQAAINNSPTQLDAGSTPEEKLAVKDFLPPLMLQLSWQKLLEQVFQYHSELIRLTRYPNRGSIIAQKDNSNQSAIEEVPLPIFCSLIDEIKRMARLPLDLSDHSKKVVLERFYQQERILLRLEFAVQNEQEVVVVQILRGKNLAIYEQKQMDKACDQALYLAKQLEKTLRRIQASFDSAEFTNIKELQTIQSRINHQLRLLDK